MQIDGKFLNRLDFFIMEEISLFFLKNSFFLNFLHYVSFFILDKLVHCFVKEVS
jgi:hypothetical protein